MVGGVGKVLGLERQTRPRAVRAREPRHVVHHVGGVQLNARLVAQHVDGQVGGTQRGVWTQRARLAVHHEAGVERGGVHDAPWGAQIVQTDGNEPSSGDQLIVHLDHLRARHRDQLLVGRAGRLASCVEVTVVGEVHHGGRGGGGRIGHAQLTRRDRVPHRRRQLARKALIAIGADDAERHRIGPHLGDRPDPSVKAVRASVQRAGALVGAQNVAGTVQREPGAADAVGEPSDGEADAEHRVGVALGVGVTERHVASGHHHPMHGGADRQQLDGQVVGFEADELNRLAVDAAERHGGGHGRGHEGS